MSDEDIQKVMNFLIQRQEVFAENLERIEAVVGTLSDTVAVLVRSQTQLTEAQTQTQKNVSFLAQSLTQLTKEVRGE